jgi:competence protein ComEC
VGVVRFSLENLRKNLALDEERLVLWLPVLLAVGIGFYFSLRVEPDLWPVLLVVVFLALCVGVERFWQNRMMVAAPVWRRLGAGLLLGVFVIAVGFMAAKLRTVSLNQNLVMQETPMVTVSGIVRDIEFRQSDIRLTIDVSEISGLVEEEMPKRVRLTWRGSYFNIEPGMTVRMRSILTPLPPPTHPGAYDYARQLYFEGVGATGYGVGAPNARWSEGSGGLFFHLQNLRTKLTARIRQASPRKIEAGAIAAALVTGRRTEIPPDAQQALRDSGLAHLLAISGLHMGLIAGFVFFVFRALLALNTGIATRYPIKKWAAIAALLAGFAYLLLSGAPWSARRAFLMSGLVFGAVLLDRRVLSLRLVAVAAFLILILSPEALFQSGFQMSFAAVTVLIGVYEYWRQRQERLLPLRKGVFSRAGGFIVGIGVTSFLAGLATAPFALFHFNRIAVFGLLGNLLAMPLVILFIMPLAVVGLALYPLGLDIFAWRGMALGIEQILAISHYVAGLDGAVKILPAMSVSALLLVAFGTLVLVIHRSVVKWLGLGMIVLAVLLWRAPEVEVYLSEDLKNFAVRVETPEGERFALWSRRSKRFAAQNWLRAAGHNQVIIETPRFGEKKGLLGPCLSSSLCRVTSRHGLRLAVISDAAALGQACDSETDLILSLVVLEPSLRLSCRVEVISPLQAKARGASVLLVRKSGEGQAEFEWRANRQWRGARPWTGGGG